MIWQLSSVTCNASQMDHICIRIRFTMLTYNSVELLNLNDEFHVQVNNCKVSSQDVTLVGMDPIDSVL